MEEEETPMRLIRSSAARSVLVVTLTIMIAYLPMIDQLGLYYGDITFLWIGESLGADSLIAAISDDRPGAGAQFALAHALFGTNLLAWHGYAFALRLVGGLALLWGLRAALPNYPLLTTAAAALTAVYPGFLAQPMAINLQNYIGAWAFSLISLAATLRAASAQRPLPLHLLAFATALIYLFLLESYVAGIEVLRVLLLLFHAGAPAGWRRKIVWVARQLAIPLIGVALFWGWRLFIYDDSAREITSTRELFDLVRSGFYAQEIQYNLGAGLQDALLRAWYAPLELRLPLATPEMLAAAGVSGLAYLLMISPAVNQQPSMRVQRFAALLLCLGGMLSALAALALLALTLQVPRLSPYESRLLLLSSLGAVLLLVGTAALLPRVLSRVTLAALLSAAVLTQMTDTRNYIAQWDNMRTLWQQLQARIPGLVPNTTLIVDFPGYNEWLHYDHPHDEVLFPVNWIYAESLGRLDYGGLYLSEGFQPNLAEERKFLLPFRSGWLNYDTNMSDVIILHILNSGGCVQVIHPGQTDNHPSILIRHLGRFSDPTLIDTAATAPDLPPFYAGDLVSPWCDLYQRAMLARQRGDLAEVARLRAQAQALGDPVDADDWAAFTP
jgi:hypothetical protein